MVVLLINLLVVLAAAPQITISPGTGRLVGRVVDASTGTPIAGVSVNLNGPVSPTAPWPPPSVPPPLPPRGSGPPPPLPDPSVFLLLGRLRTETNSDGVFEIRDVPNGRWAVQARKDGYVPLTPAAMPLMESKGERLTVPAIRLDRGGAITGRVLDPRGNPMARVMVRTTQVRKLPDGTIQTTGGSSAVETNDLGDYRLSGLMPGEHYVLAQPPPQSLSLFGPKPTQALSTVVTTFYPGLLDIAVASPVTVARGATTNAINFSLAAVPAYEVTGTVVDSGGRPVAGAIVRLAARTPFRTSMQSEPSQSNGSFRITNVPAGTYGAMAAVPLVTRTAAGGSGSLSFGDAARPGAAPEVIVQGDVGNLRVVAVQP